MVTKRNDSDVTYGDICIQYKSPNKSCSLYYCTTKIWVDLFFMPFNFESFYFFISLNVVSRRDETVAIFRTRRKTKILREKKKNVFFYGG